MSRITTAKAFKAIILANENSNALYPFHNTPAPGLLPVLTKPILDYQVELLERSGFDQCIIICNPNDEENLNSWATEYRANHTFSIRIVVTNSTDKIPACEALRQVITRTKNKLSLDCDFLVLPSDLICTEPLTKFLAYHHYKRATMTMMLTQPPPEEVSDTVKNAKNAKGGKKPTQQSNQLIDPRLEDPESPLYIGLDTNDGRLCLLREADEEEGLKLHKDIIRQVNSFTLYTNLRSPSVYIFSREALQLLQEYPDIETLEVLAQFLVGMQFVTQNPRYTPQSSVISQYQSTQLDDAPLLAPHGLDRQPSMARNTAYLNGAYNYKSGPRGEDIVGTTDIAMGCYGDNSDDGSISDESTYMTAAPTGHTKKGKKSDDEFTFSIPNLSCFAFIPPPTALVLRSDNLTSYTFLNKKLSQSPLPSNWIIDRPPNFLSDILDRIQREQRSAVPEAVSTPADSNEPEDPKAKAKAKAAAKKNAKQSKPEISGWFAQDTVWDQGVIIVNSIIGRHCRIGKNCILKDVILMDYAEVGENCKLDQVILGPNAAVEKGQQISHDSIAAAETE